MRGQVGHPAAPFLSGYRGTQRRSVQDSFRQVLLPRLIFQSYQNPKDRP